jgi:DNA-binding NarL/FixJ family response regulator
VIEKLAGLRSPPRVGARSAEIGDLTPREREVLGLISHGMADADIAAKLGLTRSTVRNHVATLYSKIGVHSRSSAIIWARERGINFAWPSAAAANLIRGPIAQGKTAGAAMAGKSRRT